MSFKLFPIMTLLYGACGALSLNPGTKDALEFSSKDRNPFWFIITTPVKPPNKGIMEESSEKSKIEAIVPAKSDQQVHNLRNKRAEMERYIPKPVAKEMAQQESSQQMVSSISQAPVLRLDAQGREIDEHGNVVNITAKQP